MKCENKLKEIKFYKKICTAMGFKYIDWSLKKKIIKHPN